MKWLVEISRKQYQYILKEKLTELNNIVTKNIEYKPKGNGDKALLFRDSRIDFFKVDKISSVKKDLEDIRGKITKRNIILIQY